MRNASLRTQKYLIAHPNIDHVADVSAVFNCAFNSCRAFFVAFNSQFEVKFLGSARELKCAGLAIETMMVISKEQLS